MTPLAPCPGCHRHVRITEPACPFCQGALGAAIADAVVPAATRRLKRAAAFAFTASLTVAGCTSPNNTDGGAATDSLIATDHPLSSDAPATDTGNTGVDSATDVATGRDAPQDDGALVAAYGGPFMTDSGVATDATPGTDTGPADTGGAMALYGSPPVWDV